MLPLLHLALLDPRLNRLRHAAAIVLFLAIVIAGSIPGARADVGEYASGLVLHSTAYAVLALLWFTGSRGNGSARARATVLTIAVMGAIDESVQSFFPYRGADVHDWMVDVSAALVVSAILWALLPKAAQERS
ncbi:VanZ family protein [Massilia suwonensis]|uniref:VanZ family protein n=1 Tax=Massilia suwonensis TaxID=648895 RepID=A0ABW0MGS7_9BURK